MNDDYRLLKLLERWQDRRERGEALDVTQICADCPDLRAAFEARMRQMAALDTMLGEASDTPGEQALVATELPRATQSAAVGNPQSTTGYTASSLRTRFPLDRYRRTLYLRGEVSKAVSVI